MQDQKTNDNQNQEHETNDYFDFKTKNDQEIDLAKVNKKLHQEIQEVKTQLDKIKQEQDKLILATKVNTLKEQEIRNNEFKKYINQVLLQETIIPSLLEFERALNFKTDNKDVKNFLIGFKHIFNNFQIALKTKGLEQITANVGDLFDSVKNNAVETIEINQETNEQKDNMIAEVLLSGYKLYDRVINPVEVKVYKLKAESKNIAEKEEIK